jgi:hypothetical protein
MKYFSKILLFVLFTLVGCQADKVLKQYDKEKVNYENQFFSLDFTEENVDIEELRNHFFTTFPHDDPTLGNVVYDRAKWTSKDMIKTDNNGLYSYVKLREDSTGFDSFRYTTKSFYNLNKDVDKILFVFKGKLPSAKGMWPAWWLNGSNENEWTYSDSIPAVNDEILARYSGVGNYYDTPSSVNTTDWPSAGEIDIIENINGEKFVHNTIHTCPQMCNSEWNNDGIIINCANAKPNDVNPGCSGKKYEIKSLEGTFACLWEKEFIRFYYWEPEINVKENEGPLSSNPNPKSWDKSNLKNSVRLLETDEECNDEFHQAWQCENCSKSNKCKFQNIKMIFNVTLCGVWAGNEFDSTANSFNNCNKYITGEGRGNIDNQFMRIDFVSVNKL